jgi:hypothetical protein
MQHHQCFAAILLLILGRMVGGSPSSTATNSASNPTLNAGISIFDYVYTN